MKLPHLRKWSKATFVGLTLISSTFQACQDHRLPPMQQELPDQKFFALNDQNVIYELNVRNTGNVLRTVNVEGLPSGEVLAGIDFRPSTGQLFAVSKSSRIYHINLSTESRPGLATALGSAPFGPAISASSVGFDFNPTVDRIRLTTNTGQNLRLHPETGALAATDGDLKGVPNPAVGAVAYTNSFAGAATTALYDIDPVANKLYLQKDPNAGILEEVGPLGLDITEVGGFDIAPWKTNDGKEYAIASVLFEGKWELDFVDITTGKLQKLGDLPSGNKIIGIAIPTQPVAYGIGIDNKLHIFDPTSTAITVITKDIKVPAGVTVVGADFRPMDGALYAVGTDNRLYTINLSNGDVVFKSTLSVPLSSDAGASFGVDFNPFADRLRIISSTGQNLRINVTTGETTQDTPLTFGGSSKGANGAAYTNSNVGLSAGAQTVLYDIDSATGKLYKQDPNPNGGVLVEVGSLGMAVDAANGFDITGISGRGHALLTTGGNTGLYTINLTTGAATKTSNFPAPVKGFALGFNL